MAGPVFGRWRGIWASRAEALPLAGATENLGGILGLGLDLVWSRGFGTVG